LRIVPAYFVVLAIYFLLPSWREYPEMAQPFWKFLLSVKTSRSTRHRLFARLVARSRRSVHLALPFLLLFMNRWPRAAIIIPCASSLAEFCCAQFLAWQHPAADVGVAFRDFQAWIYYPTWTRLDPLVFGVVLAAIENFVRPGGNDLPTARIWLWLPALALISYGLWLGEGEYLSSRQPSGNFR